jgi:hypothetical protein
MPLWEKYMKRLFIVLSILIIAATVNAQSTVILKGLPLVKISEGGVSRVSENILKDNSANFKCIIIKIGGSYYWNSRENISLLRIDSGAFSTFVAKNGSGYIRMVNPAMKDAASLMSRTEMEYDYVEHLLIGLRGITYYGIIE